MGNENYLPKPSGLFAIEDRNQSRYGYHITVELGLPSHLHV